MIESVLDRMCAMFGRIAEVLEKIEKKLDEGIVVKADVNVNAKGIEQELDRLRCGIK